ncbi:TIGR03756 family integrating conjugative element protein [Nitrogeniibacter aestuarii]|uniref:TIGR03756 family integrating conjugative element protein n=1 Tax=Nitrogeniibacter aestuarii TaxID=2815343 RepID=UPI001E39AF03|nr:TIGR03756 family integrating conjugative element protein [Nitrogeniibacter aestuarii]
MMIVLGFSLTVPSARAVNGDTVTSVELITQATASFVNPACGAWHVSGICFWLKCTMFGCSIETSVRYSHRQPDVVVSTYHEAQLHPWPLVGVPLANAANQAGTSILGGMFDSAGTMFKAGNRSDKQRRWRDGDVIGHPAASMQFGSVSCPSGVTSFFPYYHSVLDSWVWRGILPVELLYPGAWIPTFREVSTMPLTSTWGSVFPRHGELVQQHPVKNAAVLSQRIGDFVTRGGQPHIYNKLPSDSMTKRDGMLVWDPSAVTENDFRNVWQLSAPMFGPAAATCSLFGNPDAGPLSYGDYATSSSHGHAFTLWRNYGCCDVKGAFIGAVIWGLW